MSQTVIKVLIDRNFFPYDGGLTCCPGEVHVKKWMKSVIPNSRRRHLENSY